MRLQNTHIENTHRKRKTQYTHRKHNTLTENTIHYQKRNRMRRKRNTHTETKTLTENGKHNTLTENTIHSQKTKYTFLLRWPPYSVYRNRIP